MSLDEYSYVDPAGGTVVSDDFIQMSEYIEIKFMPDGIVDLAEFISTLEAINTEYRQWLDH